MKEAGAHLPADGRTERAGATAPSGSPAHAARAHRRGARGALVSGGLLVACLFLPAIDGCHGPLYPYTFVLEGDTCLYVWPYLLGAIVVALAVKRLCAPDAPARWLERALIAVVALVALGLGILLNIAMVADPSPLIAGAVLWWFMAWPLVSVLRPRHFLEWRAARAVWLSGLLTGGWFAPWLIAGLTGDESVYSGLWLSAAASLGLVAAGWQMERGLRRAPDPPIPPARAT